MDFDFRQLEVFCKVLELGSFSKAAEEVCLAQASVSERIANLERMVGTRLLDRLGRKVVPTQAGERLYRSALPLLGMKRTVCQEMEAFLGVQSGEIHLGGSTIPGEYLLPAVLGRFRHLYPRISVRVEISDTGKIHEGVLNGVFEMGIVGSRSSDHRLLHHPLWEDELVLAIRSNHPWADRTTVRWEDLSQEPFILREKGSGTQESLQDHLRRIGSAEIEHLRVAATLGTSTAVKEGVKAGLGVAFLSLRAMETEIQHGVLRVLRLENMPLKRVFFMIQDRRRTASPLCRAMASFLIESSKEARRTPLPESATSKKV